MSDYNLKPCPFCGGKAIFKKLSSCIKSEGRIGFEFEITCTKCEVSIGLYNTIVDMDKNGKFIEKNNARADLAGIWNKRVDGKE